MKRFEYSREIGTAPYKNLPLPLQKLSKAFKRDGKRRRRKSLLLTAAVPAKRAEIDSGYYVKYVCRSVFHNHAWFSMLSTVMYVDCPTSKYGIDYYIKKA